MSCVNRLSMAPYRNIRKYTLKVTYTVPIRTNSCPTYKVPNDPFWRSKMYLNGPFIVANFSFQFLILLFVFYKEYLYFTKKNCTAIFTSDTSSAD